ncbi:MAG: lactoylglutathione lyase [Alteromonadaceae bacterium]|jgi:lactoylglutathione lyase
MKRLKSAVVIAASLLISIPAVEAHAPDKGTPKPRVMTKGLNHLGLTVSKLDETVDFFTDQLGWRYVGGDTSYPSKFVTDGEIFLTLWQTTKNEKVIKFNRKTNIGLHHLALSVDSFEILDELYERFKKAKGVVIEFAPETNRGGPTKHMMIREPSGNRIEFAYNPPRKK